MSLVRSRVEDPNPHDFRVWVLSLVTVTASSFLPWVLGLVLGFWICKNWIVWWVSENLGKRSKPRILSGLGLSIVTKSSLGLGLALGQKTPNPSDFGFWVSSLQLKQLPETQLDSKIKRKISHPKSQPMKITQTQNPKPKKNPSQPTNEDLLHQGF